MKSLDGGSKENKASKSNSTENCDQIATVEEKIDFSNVKIEPLFEETVDFDTFSKSDFRAVKVKECVAVPKSKKLLQFTLDDGTGVDRTILSGIHAYYEPEELVGKTEFTKEEENIIVDSKNISIIFNKYKAKLVVKNTLVEYNFYYSSKLEVMTSYDSRFYQYHETNYLYFALINLVKNLISEPLIYEVNKKKYSLTTLNSNIILYQNKHLKKNKTIVKEEINLK